MTDLCTVALCCLTSRHVNCVGRQAESACFKQQAQHKATSGIATSGLQQYSSSCHFVIYIYIPYLGKVKRPRLVVAGIRLDGQGPLTFFMFVLHVSQHTHHAHAAHNVQGNIVALSQYLKPTQLHATKCATSAMHIRQAQAATLATERDHVSTWDSCGGSPAAADCLALACCAAMVRSRASCCPAGALPGPALLLRGACPLPVSSAAGRHRACCRLAWRSFTQELFNRLPTGSNPGVGPVHATEHTLYPVPCSMSAGG